MVTANRPGPVTKCLKSSNPLVLIAKLLQIGATSASGQKTEVTALQRDVCSTLDTVAIVERQSGSSQISHARSIASCEFLDCDPAGNSAAIYGPVYEAHDFSHVERNRCSRRALSLFWLWLQPSSLRALIPFRDAHQCVQGWASPNNATRQTRIRGRSCARGPRGSP